MNLNKTISSAVVAITLFAIVIIAYFTYLWIMPIEHWVNYKTVEPLKDLFCKNEPLIFESKFSVYRSVDMEFNDILYCSSSKEVTTFVYTSSYDSRHTKVSEQAEGRTQWRYNQFIPVPAYCYLSSNVSILLPWGIKKTKTIKGGGFLYGEEMSGGRSMNEDTIRRIDKLLREEEDIPIFDAAGIVTPEGIDAAARIKAIKACLRIIKEEP